MRINKLFIFLFIMFLFTFCTACSTPVQKIEVKGKSLIEKKLTLMIYMAADNDLETYALQNLKAMEKSECDFEALNVLVLLDRAEGYDETDGNWTDTRLFEVQKDSSKSGMIKSKRLACSQLGLSSENNTELDMANPNVLKTFIEFCRAEYEAENYCLIIWGHGTGWRGVTVDDRSGNYMSVYDMGRALQGQGLCVIGFDICFGGVIENIYELKDCAEYTVACPGVTPGDGWNYKVFLESLLQDENLQRFQQLDSPLFIAKKMVQSSSVPVTVFRNENLSGFMQTFEDFSHSLSQTIITASDKQAVFNHLFALKSYSYSQYPCDMYLDIPAMADFYSSDTNADVAQAAINLQTQISKTIVSNETGVGIGTGIGIHFIPMSSARTASATHSSDYLKDSSRTDQCAFIKESQWWVPTIGGNTGSLLDKLFY